MRFSLDELTGEERAFLDAFGFDEVAFCDLAGHVGKDGYDPSFNWVKGHLSPPPPGTLEHLPLRGSLAWEAVESAGAQALAEGKVAVVLLNGGMATRFGGVVKGIVEALPGRSFLQLAAQKLLDLEERWGGRIPFLLMNSFATDEATRRHLDSSRHLGLDPSQIRTFIQRIMPRLRPDGALFRDSQGQASFYGPGHGDLGDSLRDSGCLSWLEAQGVRMILTYNVDNLGAGPLPEVVGQHLMSGVSLTAELVERLNGDSGGCPALLDGKVQIFESFRFPPSFDATQVPVFNTNTLLLNLEVLRASHPLTWFQVKKQVSGGEVIQFERLVGELTAQVSSQYLVVPRFGVSGRFLPVKTPGDLAALQPLYREMFPRRSSLRIA